MFLNSTPFGVTDPEFGIDVGFYAFQLPFFRWVLDWLFVAVAICFVVALIAHYLFGGIRLTGRAGQVSAAARAQLADAGRRVRAAQGRRVLPRPVRAAVLRPQPDLFTGATYTDLNAVMPAKLILLFISIICAAAFFVAVFRRNLQLPAIAVVLLVLSSVLIGAAWPAVLQQFVVAPERERAGGGADRAQHRRHPAGVRARPTDKVDQSSPTRAPRRRRPAAVRGRHRDDPEHPAARPEQARPRRSPSCSSGATSTASRTSSTSTATRSTAQTAGLRGRRARARTATAWSATRQDWINRHLVYTHGNGFVVAPANQVNAAAARTPAGRAACRGSPHRHRRRSVRDPRACGSAEPRIYYGELITDYSIVGAEEGGAAAGVRLRHAERTPTPAPAGCRSATCSTGWCSRWRYGERNILFNSSINDNSKIMYVRNPRTGCEAVAPWLTLDSDPYPAVVDGRITWIVDGYTTLAELPVRRADVARRGHHATPLQGVPRAAGRARSATCATR